MYMFNSPLEQFEINPFTNAEYVHYWEMTDFHMGTFDAFCNPMLLPNDGGWLDILQVLLVLIFVKILSGVSNIKNMAFIFFFVLASLSSVNLMAFKDFKVIDIHVKMAHDFNYVPPFGSDAEFLKYKGDEIVSVDGVVGYIAMHTEWFQCFTVAFAFFFGYFLIYLLNWGMTSVNTMMIIPSFVNMIGEIIYKATFDLFVSTLGKDITSREYFIKVKTIFIFLIVTNVQGMIPFMSTITSSLANTFFMALALFISIIITILDQKGINYFLRLFMPPGCPIALIFLLIPIEVISYSFRVVSLSVRLFANMMAGHTLLKVIVGFSWVMVFLGDYFVILNAIPVLTLFILTGLEVGVALIQAYIFTILSCIYIRDIFEGH